MDMHTPKDEMFFSALPRAGGTGSVLIAGTETALSEGAGVFVPYAGPTPIAEMRAIE